MQDPNETESKHTRSSAVNAALLEVGIDRRGMSAGSLSAAERVVLCILTNTMYIYSTLTPEEGTPSQLGISPIDSAIFSRETPLELGLDT
jgi:hypothetical protein